MPLVELTYNAFNFHGLGDLEIVGPSSAFEPPEMPQRVINTIRVKLDIYPAGDFNAGQSTLAGLRAALKSQNQTLLWRKLVNGSYVNYVNQTATVNELETPPDGNDLGTRHRRVLLQFSYAINLTDVETGGQVATFMRAGGSAVITLGNITKMNDRYTADRFNKRRSDREHYAGAVLLTGFFRADTTAAVAVRREALLTLKNAMYAEVQVKKEGTLTYGDPAHGGFNRTVRVSEFVADVDQDLKGINWTVAATYALDEDDVVAEFTAGIRDAREWGHKAVAFSGVVRAPMLATALTKLDVLRAAVLGLFTDKKTVRLRGESRPQFFSQSADGDVAVVADLNATKAAFTELSFDEEHLVFDDARGADVSLKYAVKLAYDWKSLRKVIRVDGELCASAATITAAQGRASGNFLDAFYTLLGYSKPEQETRDVDHEFLSGTWTSGQAVPAVGAGAGASADAVQKLVFDATFNAAITGEEGILECDLTESVTYSGTRWVEQPLPDAPSEMQGCGTTTGNRTVSGSVSAATAAIAQGWALKKRKLLAAQTDPAPVPPIGFEQPPQMSFEFKFLPRTYGVVDARDTEASPNNTPNSHCAHVTFTFSEVLPNCPLV